MHNISHSIDIAKNAPALPSCFNAQDKATYKDAIDARVSALFKEHLYEIIALAVVFSPVFFMALPLGYITLRDIAKDQVDSALAHEKLKYLENVGAGSNITHEREKYFTETEQCKMSSMASYLKDNKSSIYQKGKTTTEIWEDLAEKSQKLEESNLDRASKELENLDRASKELENKENLISEFKQKITKPFLEDSNEKTNRAISEKNATEHNHAHIERNMIPKDESGKQIWPEHLPSPLQAITRDVDSLPGYMITEFTDNNILQEKTKFENFDQSKKTEVTLKTFAEHCGPLFDFTKKISQERSLTKEHEQKINDLIMLSMTANYRSPLVTAANQALLSIANVNDEDGKKIEFLIAGDSEESYHTYAYEDYTYKEKKTGNEKTICELTITIQSEFGIKTTESNDLVNAKLKQTSQLVINLNDQNATPLWKTVSLSIA